GPLFCRMEIPGDGRGDFCYSKLIPSNKLFKTHLYNNVMYSILEMIIYPKEGSKQVLKDADKIKRVKNKFLLSQRYHEELEHFSTDKIANVLKFQKTHKQYAETPLVSLDHLSKHLNVASIQVKDESKRFGLNAFKVMGGIYAIGKYIADKLGRNIETISFEELQSEEVKEQIGNITFISATDGNHGRGVAWAARELGQKSIIYMPKGSSESR